MNKKIGKTIFGIFFVLVIIASLSVVSAVTTLVNPAANAVVAGGSVIFNATTTDITNVANTLANFTFYAQSTLTANSTWS